MKKILILAIFLRILVSVFLFHPDIKTYNFQSSFLKKGVVNIYPYLEKNKQDLPLKEEFVYFPLTYFVIGGYQAIISIFTGNGLDAWLSDAGANSTVQNPGIFWYLILLKFPYLVLDIVIAYLLMDFFEEKKKKEKAFVLWLFNPFTIILIYAFSNLDLYPVFLTILAFLQFKKEKLLKGSAFIGLASCFKLYPLLFVPFLFLKGENIKRKLTLSLVPAGILFLSVLPFLSRSFVSSALVSGLSTRIFNPGFSIGFGESMIVGLLFLSSLFFYTWLTGKNINLLNYWVSVLLIIFSFSHFHISWLLWLAPFLVILVVKNSKLIFPILLLSSLAVAIPLFYEDRSMTISLFRVYSTWFDLLPTPFSVIEKVFDPYVFQSILHSLFAGGSMVLSIKLLSVEKGKVKIN